MHFLIALPRLFQTNAPLRAKKRRGSCSCPFPSTSPSSNPPSPRPPFFRITTNTLHLPRFAPSRSFFPSAVVLICQSIQPASYRAQSNRPCTNLRSKHRHPPAFRQCTPDLRPSQSHIAFCRSPTIHVKKSRTTSAFCCTIILKSCWRHQDRTRPSKRASPPENRSNGYFQLSQSRSKIHQHTIPNLQFYVIRYHWFQLMLSIGRSKLSLFSRRIASLPKSRNTTS